MNSGSSRRQRGAGTTNVNNPLSDAVGDLESGRRGRRRGGGGAGAGAGAGAGGGAVLSVADAKNRVEDMVAHVRKGADRTLWRAAAYAAGVICEPVRDTALRRIVGPCCCVNCVDRNRRVPWAVVRGVNRRSWR